MDERIEFVSHLIYEVNSKQCVNKVPNFQRGNVTAFLKKESARQPPRSPPLISAAGRREGNVSVTNSQITSVLACVSVCAYEYVQTHHKERVIG